MTNLSPRIAETQFLPAAFELVPRLLALTADPEANSEQIAEVIRLDPGLTADVLRVCNSARYAGNYRVETLQEAVMRLGLREVYRVVTGVITSPIISGSAHPAQPPSVDLWNHSLAAACAGQILAQEKGGDPEVIFTAGLLHDIGKVLLIHLEPDAYSTVLHEAGAGGQQLLDEEKKSLGINHADAGAILLKRWNFSPGIVAAVQFHHRPNAAGEHTRIAALARMSDSLAYAIGQPPAPDQTNSPDPATLELLELTEPEFHSLKYQVLHAFQREKSVFE